jgi:hypothetical protein
MGEIRHVAFGTGAERQCEAEKYEKPRKGADARDYRRNIRH